MKNTIVYLLVLLCEAIIVDYLLSEYSALLDTPEKIS